MFPDTTKYIERRGTQLRGLYGSVLSSVTNKDTTGTVEAACSAEAGFDPTPEHEDYFPTSIPNQTNINEWPGEEMSITGEKTAQEPVHAPIQNPTKAAGRSDYASHGQALEPLTDSSIIESVNERPPAPASPVIDDEAGENALECGEGRGCFSYTEKRSL